MIKTFEINNQIGDKVMLMDLGARLVSWQTNVADEVRDIVIHYPNVQDYYNDSSYLGAVIGPYAGIINQASCNINNKQTRFNADQNKQHINGGKNALDTCVWQVKEHSERAITFKYWLEDGFNGYPGAMTFEVEYRLAEKTSQLKVNFNVVAEKPTIIGPSNFVYFNLSADTANIDQHKLEIFSDEYVEKNSANLPTGNTIGVENTALDFRTMTELSSKKLDQDFVINSDNESHAVLTSPCGKLSMLVKSDYPAIHACSGEQLVKPLANRQGVSLAPQFIPDSPNHSQFSFELTHPDNPFNKKIVYKLKK